MHLCFSRVGSDFEGYVKVYSLLFHNPGREKSQKSKWSLLVVVRMSNVFTKTKNRLTVTVTNVCRSANYE